MSSLMFQFVFILKRNGRLQAVGRDSSLAVGSQRQHREGSQARQLKMGSSGCQGIMGTYLNFNCFL